MEVKQEDTENTIDEGRQCEEAIGWALDPVRPEVLVRRLTGLNRGHRLAVHHVLDAVSKSPGLVRVWPDLAEVDIVNTVEWRCEESYVLHVLVNDLL